MPVYLSILNFKGGVAKTSSVGNIGAGLARAGKKVLLIDLDAQHNLTQSFEVSSVNPSRTVFDVLTQTKIPPLEYVEVVPNLSIACNELHMIRFDMMVGGMAKREYRLRKAVLPVADKFDYIICDCPPALGVTTFQAIFIDPQVKILVPIEGEFLAMKGYSILAQTLLDELELEVDGIFVTKYDKRKVIMQRVMTALQEQQSDKLFKTAIRTNVAITEAQAGGLSIFDYTPKSHGAEDYLSLTNEIISKYG